MKRNGHIPLFGTGLSIAAVSLAPSLASAASLALSLGPFSLPSVPVEVCIDDTCITTPQLSAATLETSIQVQGLALPLVLPGACPAGQIGAVLTVASLLPTTATIDVSVSGDLNGEPFEQGLGPISTPLGPGSSTTISLCSTL